MERATLGIKHTRIILEIIAIVYEWKNPYLLLSAISLYKEWVLNATEVRLPNQYTQKICSQHTLDLVSNNIF